VFVGNAQVALNLSSFFLSFIIAPHTKQTRKAFTEVQRKAETKPQEVVDTRGEAGVTVQEKKRSSTCFLAGAGNCSPARLQHLLELQQSEK